GRAQVIGPGGYDTVRTAPHLATNALLAAASTLNYPNGVWRDDYASGVGAPALFYLPADACPYSTGADGSTCVASSNSKFWVAQVPAAGLDLREWGVKFDGSTDNSTALGNVFAWLVLGNRGVIPAAASAAKFGSAISE